MLDHSAAGVFAIAPTPFREDGAIDWKSIDNMTDFYERAGCDGITILGVMGEASKLDAQEARDVASRVIRRAGRMQIVVGVTAPGFAVMRALTQDVMAAGAAGVMIAPPNTLRTDDQIVTYYTQAASAIGPAVPFVIQDYPLNFQVVMTPEVIRRVATDNANCVMLKHEDWPGLEKISALRRMQAQGRLKPLSILCGNGGLFIDFECERGADGAMTGYAFPEMLVDVVRLTRSGSRGPAHDIFDAHLPLLRYEQQPGIGLAVRKYVLARRGIIGNPAQRSPGGDLSATARAEVDYLLNRLSRTDSRAAAPAT